jgi:hypothetical protein
MCVCCVWPNFSNSRIRAKKKTKKGGLLILKINKQSCCLCAVSNSEGGLAT